MALVSAELYNAGTLTVNSSDFSGNGAVARGGSIYNGGTLTVNNSNFSVNGGQGGGISNLGSVIWGIPAYSPELNAIESVFGVIKHYDLPQRSYATLPALLEAVDGAFTRAQQRLVARCEYNLRITP